MSRGRQLAVAGLIVLGAIGLDQATKDWALGRLSGNRTIDVLPTLEFDLAYNSGFSFSTGSGNGHIVGAVVIALCLFLFWQIVRETRTRRLVLYAIILGGALGNLVDRVFRADDGFLSGEVVDFIDVSWYAVFNIADIFVVCGCIAFVIDELVVHRAATAAAGNDSRSAVVDGT